MRLCQAGATKSGDHKDSSESTGSHHTTWKQRRGLPCVVILIRVCKFFKICCFNISKHISISSGARIFDPGRGLNLIKCKAKSFTFNLVPQIEHETT